MPKLPGLAGEVIDEIQLMIKPVMTPAEIDTMLAKADECRCHPCRGLEMQAAVRGLLPVVWDHQWQPDVVTFTSKGQVVGEILLAEPPQGG